MNERRKGSGPRAQAGRGGGKSATTGGKGARKGGGTSAGKAAGKLDHKLRGAERKIRRGEAEGAPKAVERRPEAPAEALDSRHTGDARVAWLLDLLALGRTGRVAERLDLRAQRATMPPVVLAGRADDPADPIVALDDAAAIGRLAARNRAFSQIAARFAPLAMVAREQGRPLRIELWDIGALVDGADAVPRLPETAEALARYLEAEFVLPDADALQAALAAGRAALAEHPDAARIRERNPLAWMP